jgi:hypothetical protein
VGGVAVLQIVSLMIVHVYRIKLANSSLELLTHILWALVPAALVGFLIQLFWMQDIEMLVRFGVVSILSFPLCFWPDIGSSIVWGDP